MMWDLEERVEDAVASYLRTKVAGDVRVDPAYERDENQFPCCIVHAAGSSPVVDEAEWHTPQKIDLAVAVMTEAAAERDTNNVVLRSARQRNALARSDVKAALATTGLVAALAPFAVVAKIAFSQAQLGRSERTVEDRVFMTTYYLDVIAEPVE